MQPEVLRTDQTLFLGFIESTGFLATNHINGLNEILADMKAIIHHIYLRQKHLNLAGKGFQQNQPRPF